ncbi:MAG: hypothetical protein AB1925_03600 [Actinomycetota bacterium]
MPSIDSSTEIMVGTGFPAQFASSSARTEEAHPPHVIPSTVIVVVLMRILSWAV